MPHINITMNKYLVLALIALFCISFVAGCTKHSRANNNRDEDDDCDNEGRGHHHRPDYFYHFTGWQTINGVPPATRIKWMRYAMQTRLTAQGPCPRDAFGAVLVHRPTDTALCATTGIRSTFDPTDHAEIRIIRECSALAGLGRNKTAWAELSLYTTGESCPMCMSATRWAGVGENIYATTIDKLTDLGFTQILIDSLEVDQKSVEGNVVPPTILINYSPKAYYDQYFSWQLNPTAPCPGGCVRNSANVCVAPTPTA